MQAWINPTAIGVYQCIVAKGSYSGAGRRYGMLIDPSGNIYVSAGTNNGSPLLSTKITANNWQHVVVTWDGSSVINVYLNGSLDGQTTGITASGISESAIMGFLADPGGGGNFTGSIDEISIASGNFSANWIRAEYNNQSSPSTFSSIGTETSLGGGGGYLTPVGMPTFSPAPGAYSSSQSVSISTSTSGASIRYTTNGTTPSETAGALYTGGAITVSTSTTIKAIAYLSGMADSEIATANYTISGTSGGGDYLTYYTYDAWDNVRQVSMPRPSGTQR
jgi:hypothetical protein